MVNQNHGKQKHVEKSQSIRTESFLGFVLFRRMRKDKPNTQLLEMVNVVILMSEKIKTKVKI